MKNLMFLTLLFNIPLIINVLHFLMLFLALMDFYAIQSNHWTHESSSLSRADRIIYNIDHFLNVLYVYNRFKPLLLSPNLFSYMNMSFGCQGRNVKSVQLFWYLSVSKQTDNNFKFSHLFCRKFGHFAEYSNVFQLTKSTHQIGKRPAPKKIPLIQV